MFNDLLITILVIYLLNATDYQLKLELNTVEFVVVCIMYTLVCLLVFNICSL